MRSFALWCHDRHRIVIAAWVALIVAAGALAAASGGAFVNNFSLPGTESQKALDLLQTRFPQASGDSDQIVFKSDGASLSDPAQRAQIAKVIASVRSLPSVASVQSPLQAPGQISRDGSIGFATLLFDKPANDLDRERTRHVVEVARSGSTATLQVNLGGQAVQAAEQSAESPGEAIGLVVAIVVLLVVLGSFAAMTIPLVVAISAIVASSALIVGLASVVDVANFAPTLAIMIGLGVGIDYALLIINRFRAERSDGADVRSATGVALDTAGRSVLFAGTTVVIALLGMLVLGVGILNAPAVAAALTVALTMLSALTLLPALLRAYGHRVKPAAAAAPGARGGVWARLSGMIRRRPWAVGAAALVLLLVVASPATSLRLGTSDAGTAPSDTTQRHAYDDLASGFGPGFNGPLLVAATLPREGGQAAARQLRATLAQQSGVANVTTPVLNGTGDTAVLSVYPSSAPQDEATKDLLTRLRDDVVPRVEQQHSGLDASIGGATATSVDVASVLSSKLPLFIGIVVGLSLILLAIVFRSLVIPLKAAVMNLLSIGASLGVVTFVFQQGHLLSLLGSTAGPIDPFVPVFLFAIVFGLSMDYEVFLVSRMHEEWEHTHDASHSVDRGLTATGKVVMAAAIIMISVFAGFMLGDNRIIQLLGLGLAAAILFDAFVIRLVLVPAVMYLLGRAAWWMPSWLGRRLPRLSVEGPSAPAPVSAPTR
ncbi:MMPL family transporter [Conexibacter sp. CPCC 206217]|uniref:MMPL family transporter n=1 Tax=Conexibacter sp. CPCC 206217 TaxID=3064574 RepID=UPI0027275169|nr:MMPL family transporter [Conexibacter sp. CPCC 206217]MDO8213304.1 MMPL family transporter [Conexibacter sp. CPCC 206217]